MKKLKRLFALILCVTLMVACFAGCHEKGEIAVTADGVEFTSGYYACVLVYCDTQARSIVEDSISVNGTIPADIVYWDFTVENTDYVKWVEDTTVETLKQIATVRNACKKAGISLSEEQKSEIQLQADNNWESVGVYMEKNGVCKDTFVEYITDLYLSDEYFKYLYGEGGESGISAEDVMAQMQEHYVLVNGLQISFTYLTDDEQEQSRQQFAEYEAALKDGSKTFEEVYLDVYNESAEDHQHGDSDDGSQPIDPHASLLSDTNSSYASEYFETAQKMELDAVKLITLADDAGLILMVKKDITADPYYLEALDITLRKELKYDEFITNLAATASGVKYEIDNFSVGQFDVKKIKYS